MTKPPFAFEFKVFEEGYNMYISKARSVGGPRKDMETCTVSVYVPPDDENYRKFDLTVTTKYNVTQALDLFREMGMPDKSEVISLAYGGRRVIKLADYWLKPKEKSRQRALQSTALAIRVPKHFFALSKSGLIERMEAAPEDKWVMILGPYDSEWRGAWLQYADTTHESTGIREQTIMYEDIRFDPTRFEKVLQAASIPLTQAEKRKLEDMLRVALPIS